MKISLNWLKDYVDVPVDAAEFARRVSLVGLAVESSEIIGSDTVFELDVTTNRPDCLNHVGVARELGAIYGGSLRKPEVALREIARKASDAVSISIDEPELCARYCGRYIAGVRIGPSPAWLKERIESVGIRAINNVADVTNYVMLELGQPLHAFDADSLHGRQIIVRRAALDETMTTLDGIERKLNPSVLVIADDDHPIALAGVMGGSDSEISGHTVNVVLESAWFSPLSIRKTARHFGMNSEASYRFERGADIAITRYACDRAAALIQELAGGEVLSGAIDVYPKEAAPVQARLRRARIPAFLGAPVEDEAVEQILSRLEFKTSRNAEGWMVEAPSFRVDIGQEEDLMEEIARHHGFDKFPSTLPATRRLGSALPAEAEERQLRNVLAGLGYSEIYTYSFADEAEQRRFRPEVEPVRLQNPLSEDASILRTSLIPGMLQAIQWNLNRGMKDLQFYEWSKVYRKGDEVRTLVFAACGNTRARTVHEPERGFDFFGLKGDVEEILETFQAGAELRTEGLPGYYHPGRSAQFGTLATFGELHPDITESLKIRQRVYLAEINPAALMDAATRRRLKGIPRFPAIRRDFSLLLAKGTQYAAVHRTITNIGIPELVRVEPLDRMESESLPEDRYALTISVIYQSPERTLTDSEVEGLDRIIIETLEQRLDAQLRK